MPTILLSAVVIFLPSQHLCEVLYLLIFILCNNLFRFVKLGDFLRSLFCPLSLFYQYPCICQHFTCFYPDINILFNVHASSSFSNILILRLQNIFNILFNTVLDCLTFDFIFFRVFNIFSNFYSQILESVDFLYKYLFLTSLSFHLLWCFFF